MGYNRERVILPPGKLEMYSDSSAVDTSASREDAAMAVQRQNSPEYINRNFFSDETALAKIRTASEGEIAVVNPTGKYAERSIMVIARDADSLDVDPIPTFSIYNLKSDVQLAYWNTILSALSSMRYMTQENGQNGLTPVATEN